MDECLQFARSLKAPLSGAQHRWCPLYCLVELRLTGILAIPRIF